VHNFPFVPIKSSELLCATIVNEISEKLKIAINEMIEIFICFIVGEIRLVLIRMFSLVTCKYNNCSFIL